jgi:hypothetical protein
MMIGRTLLPLVLLVHRMPRSLLVWGTLMLMPWWGMRIGRSLVDGSTSCLFAVLVLMRWAGEVRECLPPNAMLC